MKLKSLSLALTVALLAGCATHSDIQSHAKLQDPNRFAEIPAEIQNGWQVQANYWKQFGDPQLDALVAEGLADSPSLASAQARIRHAQALTDAAGSALWPQLSANGDVMSQRFTEHGLYPAPYAGNTRTTDRLALDASIDLDLWGKYRRALQGAEANRKLTELELVAARQALSANIVRAYLEYDRLYKQRDLLDKLMALREEAERLQGLRFKAGLDPEIDRNQYQQGIAQLKVERAQMDERINLQRNLLAALAGQGPERGSKLTAPHINENLDAHLPSVLPSDLLAGRPDLLASRWRVEAASAEVDVARDQFYPSVNLSAFAGFNSIGLEELLKPGSRIFGIGPSVHLPIFEAGRLRAGLSMKVADYDAAVDQYNANLIDALRDVSDQASSLREAQHQSELVTDSLTAAQRGAQLVKTRVDRGLATKINLINAQMAVLAQERIQTDLRAHRLDAAAGLMRALGGGFAPEYNPYTLAAAAK